MQDGREHDLLLLPRSVLSLMAGMRDGAEKGCRIPYVPTVLTNLFYIVM